MALAPEASRFKLARPRGVSITEVIEHRASVVALAEPGEQVECPLIASGRAAKLGLLGK